MRGYTDKAFQRKGAVSNTQVGREFEDKAKSFFLGEGIDLTRGFSIDIGIDEKKGHAFDLGDGASKVLVECKSHTWTEGGAKNYGEHRRQSAKLFPTETPAAPLPRSTPSAASAL